MGVGTGAAVPLLTGCILKQVIILHENVLFLHKIFKHFEGRRQNPDPTSCFLPPILNW